MVLNSATLQGIVGQEQAVSMLETALARDRLSHAYLLTGPPGVGKLDAALGLAAALCCEHGGCASCPSCSKALRGTHPDIDVISPAGAFITVDQARSINRSLNLHPGESRARVFIISEAAAFNAESANAFLKTLEEPPGFVRFILVSDKEEQVLPTIVSRCQTVRFEPIPPAVIERFLTGELGVSRTMAETAARAAGGDLRFARALCTDEELSRRRGAYIEMGMALARGEAEPAALAAAMLEAADAAGEKAAGDADEPLEGFGGAGGKQRKQDSHRRSQAARKRELAMALSILQSWFRDMMVMASGAPEAVVNRDYELELEQEALRSRAPDYGRAAEAAGAARLKLGYNIDLELMLMALFHQLQEVL